MKRFLFSILFLFCLCTKLLYSQTIVLDNKSAFTHWHQVITPSFRVIFPKGNNTQALKVANTLERLHEQETKTLKADLPKRISVILQDFTNQSNGFVSWSPRRIEFFMTPPQEADLVGTNQWEELLSVHEYRHVVQFTHSRQGITRLAFYLFGYNVQSSLAHAAVPRWFWEGDAVLSETLYSRSGRGRIPAFSRVFKANLMEGKRYSYNKQHLSSYKDLVPDHYKLGYYMVTHIRRRTGDPKIWGKITSQAFKWSIVPFTFSNALHKYTGVYLVKNYEMMMNELESIWSNEASLKTFTPFEDVNHRKETAFTDYSFPQLLPNGDVVAMKSGIGNIEEYVAINKAGREHHLFTPGIVNNSGMLSVTGEYIIWNEYQYDPRWREQDYSVIKTYNIETGKVETVTHRSRYAGASLAPDQIKIVTTLHTVENKNYLIVLDRQTGKEINRLANNDNGSYSHPRWSSDGKYIVAIKNNDAGKGIILFNYLKGTERYLIGPSRENFSNPVLEGNYLFFNSPYNGTDNIHAYNMATGKRFMVTQSRYGAYHACLDAKNKEIYYNEHRLNGLDIVKTPLDPSIWIPLDSVVREKNYYFEPVDYQEEELHLLDSIPSKEYTIKPYRKLAHFVNFNSWGLQAFSDINQLKFGVSSRDILSTTEISGGYIYDRSEKTGYGYANISYQGLYPIFDLGMEKGPRKSDRGQTNGEDILFEWKETTFTGGIRLPFVLTRSKWVSELNINEVVGLTQVRDWSNSVSPEDKIVGPLGERLVKLANDSLALYLNDELSNGKLLSNNLTLSYYALLKQSTRDLFSKYGFFISGRYLNTPFGGDFTGKLLALRSIIYLPSPLELTGSPVFKHHSLSFAAAYQWKPDEFSRDSYRFRNQIPKPRGFGFPDHSTFSYASINYALPLWYPDISVGPLVYFKRLRLNTFLDYGRGQGHRYYYNFLNDEVYRSTLDEDYLSVGGELMTDLNVIRFPEEFTIGVRYSRLLSVPGNSIEFLINFDF